MSDDDYNPYLPDGPGSRMDIKDGPGLADFLPDDSGGYKAIAGAPLAGAAGPADGDIVEVRNGRGACLCGAVFTPELMPGVVMISTGAWYDPEDAGSGGRCRHGNPNVLSPDVGTSALSQGPAAHSCLVEVTRLEGDAPNVQAFEPPAFAPRKGDAQKGDV